MIEIKQSIFNQNSTTKYSTYPRCILFWILKLCEYWIVTLVALFYLHTLQSVKFKSINSRFRKKLMLELYYKSLKKNLCKILFHTSF